MGAVFGRTLGYPEETWGVNADLVTATGFKPGVTSEQDVRWVRFPSTPASLLSHSPSRRSRAAESCETTVRPVLAVVRLWSERFWCVPPGGVPPGCVPPGCVPPGCVPPGCVPPGRFKGVAVAAGRPVHRASFAVPAPGSDCSRVRLLPSLIAPESDCSRVQVGRERRSDLQSLHPRHFIHVFVTPARQADHHHFVLRTQAGGLQRLGHGM